MHAIVILPLTSHPYKAGTEHAGFSPDHPLRKLGNQVLTGFLRACVFFVTMMVVELDHIVRGERTSIPRKADVHTT